MSNLFLTLMIAFIVIVIAIACLAIGWLITGKTKIERGACGRVPTQKKEECGSSLTCDVCAPPKTSPSKDAHLETSQSHSRDEEEQEEEKHYS